MPSDFDKFWIGLGGGAFLLGIELAISLGSSLLNLVEGILQSSPETVSTVSSLLLAPTILGVIQSLSVGVGAVLKFEERWAYLFGYLVGNLAVLIGFGITFGMFLPDVVVKLAIDFFIIILPLLVVIIAGALLGEREYTVEW